MGDDKKHRERTQAAQPNGEGPPTQRALRPVDEGAAEGRSRPWDDTPSDAAAVLSRLSRGERDFAGSRLAFSRFKSCSLRWANLDESDLRRSDFEGADLGYASLIGANLSGVCLVDATLDKTVLRDANLREADVRGADLSTADLTDADFAFAVANPKTRWPAQFEPAAHGVFVLGGGAAATPIGAAEDPGFTAHPPEPPRYVQVVLDPDDAPSSDFELGAHSLDAANEATNPGIPPSPALAEEVSAHVLFSEAVKEGQRTFQGAQLSKLHLVGANLSRLDFKGADLSSARLPRVNLRASNLRGADLRGADLQGANLVGADLRDACLEGADVRGANLSGATLPEGVRDQVIADQKTRWPSRR